ncbi:hypothetical protein A2U01_0073537, partial [Trifolium medium]|nr:hypothetical protein [Trifolium medium]
SVRIDSEWSFAKSRKLRGSEMEVVGDRSEKERVMKMDG